MLPGLWLPLYIENIFKTAIKFILPYFLDRNAYFNIKHVPSYQSAIENYLAKQMGKNNAKK
jgi:hypothetical protein